MRSSTGAWRPSRLLTVLLAMPLLAGAGWTAERLLPAASGQAAAATVRFHVSARGRDAPAQAEVSTRSVSDDDSHAARLALFEQRLAAFRSVESKMWGSPAATKLRVHGAGRRAAQRPALVQARAVFAPMAPQELNIAQSQGDADCLAQAVYYEARGESAAGQAAVAQVVLNRVRSPYYPKSVCGVVFQGATHAGCQFSFACDGALKRGVRDQAAWVRAQQVATQSLAGAGGDAALAPALNYHADYVKPKWASRLARLEKIGRHIFYQALGAVLPEGGRAPGPKAPLPPAQPDQPLPVWA